MGIPINFKHLSSEKALEAARAATSDWSAFNLGHEDTTAVFGGYASD